MAISKEALEDLNRSFQEELKKIREKEEERRKEAFSKMKFVESPTLEEDRAKVREGLIEKQEKNIAEEAKKLETKMFEDYGGSYNAGMKHFAPAYDMASGETATKFNEEAQPTPEQIREQKREDFYKETLNEFNDKSQEKSRDQDHGFERG